MPTRYGATIAVTATMRPIAPVSMLSAARAPTSPPVAATAIVSEAPTDRWSVGRDGLRAHDDRRPTAPPVSGHTFDEVREKPDRLRGKSANGVAVPDRQTTVGSTSTVVSLLLELGTPPHAVQAVARHADLDVTLSICAHTNLDAMREALDKIEWAI